LPKVSVRLIDVKLPGRLISTQVVDELDKNSHLVISNPKDAMIDLTSLPSWNDLISASNNLALPECSQLLKLNANVPPTHSCAAAQVKSFLNRYLLQ
jgi:hypothetical protein